MLSFPLKVRPCDMVITKGIGGAINWAAIYGYLARAYNPAFKALTGRVADRQGIEIKSGVYIWRFRTVL